MNNADDAEATFIPSTTSITMATGQAAASVDITPISKDGTFSKSDDSSASVTNTSASFGVTTNNYTGYTLKLIGNDTTGNLTNASYGDVLASISSTIDQSTFESSSSYTNKWGIKPSVVNSASNTDYLPAPVDTGTPATTTEILMETTNVANSTAKNYSIDIGAKVDYTKAAGTYTNTFTLVAVGNATSFTITYDKGSISDTVTNLPSATTGDTDGTYATLSSTVPQRTGYSFAGWCNGTLSGTTQNPGTTCTGTLITDGKFDLNQTTSNTVPLHATWTPNMYTCTKQYRLQPANGTFPTTYTSAGTEQVAYNNVCSYSYNGSDKADYKPSASGTNGATVSGTCTITTSGCTVSLSLYRNTYALTVSRDTNYISAASASTTPVHGANYYRWGQSVAISATTNYANFTKWTLTNASGSQISTAASTNYTMPKAATTIYANGDRPAMSSFTKSTCSTRASSGNIWLYDARDNQYYTARYINGNCWMTRNIAIGCAGTGATYSASRKSTAISLTSSNSNVSTTWSLSTSSAYSLDKADATTGCTTSSTSGCDDFTNPRMKCSASYGAWYNYAAASAKTVTGSSSTSYNGTAASSTTYSICPIGWRLPINSEQTGIASYSTAYSPVTAGRYLTGTLDYANRGYWWSSTADGGVNRYGLYKDNSSSTLATYSYSRVYGFYVRCVRSS